MLEQHTNNQLQGPPKLTNVDRFNKKIRSRVLALPRAVKRSIAVSIDVGLIIVSVWLAYFLRVGSFLPLFERTVEHFPVPATLAGIVIATPVFTWFGLYRMVFRFVDRAAFGAISQALAVYSVIYIAIFTIIGVTGVPRTIGIIQPVVLFSLICLSRFTVRFWLGGINHDHLRSSNRKRVLIYGAGSAGREVAGLLAGSEDAKAIGFLDEDPALRGQSISGLPVFAPDNLLEVTTSLSIDEILLAIPSASRRRRNAILNTLRGASLPVRTLPSYGDLIKGRVTINDIRDLSIDEILGRDEVVADSELMSRDVQGKTVVVTGAGGSIGSELCRQIFRQKPKRLILFERGEFALYSIQQEILSTQSKHSELSDVLLVTVLGSITDESILQSIFGEYSVDTIYHAAAYKHVPLFEDNSIEGVRNNVIGTQTVARVACDMSVKKFVLVSTDKAVRPTSMMGASKRIAEMILQTMSERRKTTSFAMVRFGNVLDSSGSVVPLFRRQINDGGPVTVTHSKVERYFMTISEAAQLVIQAGAMTNAKTYAGGRAPVYLLDMGAPVKIMDLARRMIELSGFSVFNQETNPNGDIEIKIVGLRPGEKLFEELLIGNAATETSHRKIFMADESCISETDLATLLKTIVASIDARNVDQLKSALVSQFDQLASGEG